ncbi:hypothetical protein Btru_004667 [Bulinus truncatus]|nr:hypothetical protein Btru_004667 [Bulinus truncatus]
MALLKAPLTAVSIHRKVNVQSKPLGGRMALRQLPYCVRGDITRPHSSLPTDVTGPHHGVYFNVCESFQVCRRRPAKDNTGRRQNDPEGLASHRDKEDAPPGIPVGVLVPDSPHANASSLPVLDCRRSQQLVWSESTESPKNNDLIAVCSNKRMTESRWVEDIPSHATTRSAAVPCGAHQANGVGRARAAQGKLWVECRPVTLSAKKPPPGTTVTLPYPGTPRGREKSEGREPPRAQRPRFQNAVRLPERVRYRSCLVALATRDAVWEADAVRSHLLPRLAEPLLPKQSCARSLGGSGQRRGASGQKTCKNSTYSEPAGIHAFTYIERVVRWLDQVPSDPLVDGADTEGPCPGVAPESSSLNSSMLAPSTQPRDHDEARDSHSGPRDLPILVPSTWLSASVPASGAPHPSRPASPWAARASLASGSVSRPTTTKGATEGSLACGASSSSSKESFYPLNLMTSSSFEKVSRRSEPLDVSPRPPNPSPCSARSPAAYPNYSSSPSPLSALSRMSPGLGPRFDADEMSFNTAECTHDQLSTNYFSSPDRRARQVAPQDGKASLAPEGKSSLTLGINVQPSVSVRYRRQPPPVSRPAQLRITTKPSKKVVRHVIRPGKKRAKKKKTKGRAKRQENQRSGPKKKSAKAVKVIKKALSMLRRKTRRLQPGARQRRCVLRELSPPLSPHSADSLTICETFQRVVGLTAQMKMDGRWTRANNL